MTQVVVPVFGGSLDREQVLDLYEALRGPAGPLIEGILKRATDEDTRALTIRGTSLEQTEFLRGRIDVVGELHRILFILLPEAGGTLTKEDLDGHADRTGTAGA